MPIYGLDLHLKAANDETLAAHILWGQFSMAGVKNTPHQAGGRWCSAENHCESVETTITFKRMKFKKQASGIYVIKFSDGHQQQGLFNVVRTPQPERILCE
jgi:hypothetical protein